MIYAEFEQTKLTNFNWNTTKIYIIEPSVCVRYIPNCLSYIETSEGLQCERCAGDLTMASGGYILSTGTFFHFI